ncbi:MAG: hypothetical protein HY606_03255, partial [Planctomycetes bacterium]|nr:hypothetical protein [Planctomycetota bacterium]
KSANAIINLINPFGKNGIKQVKLADKIESFNSELEKFLSSFNKEFIVVNKYYCAKCNKIRSAEGRCHDQELKKVRTFRCEKCGTPSAKQKKCCSQDIKPESSN